MSNQKGQLGGESVEEYLSDVNLDDELGADFDTESDDDFDGQDFDQPEDQDADSEEPTDGDLSLEDQLEEFQGEDKGQGSLLDLVNELGLTRKGMPINFESEDQIREILSKDFDYTQKTMELAEERKSTEEELSTLRSEIESERASFEEEKSGFQQQLTDYQLFADVLNHFKRVDPDMYAEFEQVFNEKQNLYQAPLNNPVFQSLQNKISELEKGLSSERETKQEKLKEETRTQWENGLKETQEAYAVKLRKLGVAPNWDKVKQVWQNDFSSELTAKSAFFAVHGEEISKALEQANTISNKRAKSLKRRGGAPIRTNGDESRQPKEPVSRSADLMDEVHSIYKDMVS